MRLTPLRVSAITHALTTTTLGAVAMLIGCTHAPTAAVVAPKPQPLTVEVDSGANLNSDPGGQPASVVVRIYQLESAQGFMDATFTDVYHSDTQTLGKALIAKLEFVALPGEHRTLQLEVANNTKILGVLVAFRDVDHASGRVTGAPGPGVLVLTLGAHSTQLSLAH
jgi:type VI secretion system protein VasD